METVNPQHSPFSSVVSWSLMATIRYPSSPDSTFSGAHTPHAQSLNDATLVASGAQGANPAIDGDQVTDNASGLNYWLLSDTNSPNHLKWVGTNGVVSAQTLNTGAGFWYWRRGTNGFNWTESRPYADPFPVTQAPPAVQDIYPNAEGDELTLDIQATGADGELLEVYYKDLAAQETFTSYNWLIAVADLPTAGSNALYWIDAGSSNRPAVNTVHSRYYLVGRGDIDQDSDDLPDSRETFVHGTDPTDYDTDGDSLGDGAELSAHGSNPLLSDTDSDGMHDGNEVGHGKDPGGSNTYSRLPFSEPFEATSIGIGTVHGQNNWEADPPLGGIVQTGIVYEGEQALQITASNSAPSVVRHLFAAPESQTVWVDMHFQAFPAQMDASPEGTACMAFDGSGQLNVYDGYQPFGQNWITLTNHTAIPEGEWVRLSSRTDYSSQEWLVCLNGVMLADGLGFGQQVDEFSAVTFTGTKGYADNVNVSETTPDGISIDGDSIPDNWEMLYFGTLTNSADGDADNDGLMNMEEYLVGTDPTSADSDHDGMADSMELGRGFDPVQSNSFFRIDAESGTNTWTTSFESDEGYAVGALEGQNGWASSNDVHVVDTESSDGLQSVQVPKAGSTSDTPAIMHGDIGGHGREVVWATLFSKPTQGDCPRERPAGTNSAVFCMNRDRLAAFDGVTNAWLFSEQQFSPLTNGWLRLDVRLDYGTKTYRVCVNSVSALKDVNFMNPELQHLCAMEVESSRREENAAAVDQVRFSTEEPAGLDFDGDGLSNDEERQLGTDLDSGDSDSDTLPDAWEAVYGLNPTNAADSSIDSDSDGLINISEYAVGTSPTNSDSDTDGMADGWEFGNGLDPTNSNDAVTDSDADGLSNLQEYQQSTDPNAADSDNDGMPDGWEVDNGLIPTDGADATVDSDGDGISNLLEFQRNTDPSDSESASIVMYADATQGDDSFDGLSPVPLGDGRGPKPSLEAITQVAFDGDRVQLAPGAYQEVSEPFDLTGKSLTLQMTGDSTIY